MPFMTGDTIPSSFRCKVIRIPDDLAFLDALNGALLELTYPSNFEQEGNTLTPQEMADVFSDAYDEYTTEKCMEIPIGSTMLWWNATPPEKWLECDNTAYITTDYPELFALLGYTFGGGGSVFNVPNMHSFSPMGVGGFIGLGATAGNTTAAIGQTHLPNVALPVTDPGHIHTLTDPGHAHDEQVGSTPAYLGTGGTGRTGFSAVVTSSLTRVVTDAKVTGATVASHATGVTVATGGSGTGLPIVHPVRGCYFIIYAGH